MVKKGIVLVVILLFMGISVTPSTATNLVEKSGFKNEDSKTIYVDDNNTEGPWDGTIEHPYQYINDAVENATSGDIIFVFSGVYQENILVDKTLSIIGENKTTTIVDGMYYKFVMVITEESVNIKNFTIRNSGGYYGNAGILVDSQNNLITNCIFYRTRSAIYVNETYYNEIKNCIFYTNAEGIYLKSSNGNIVKDCYFCHNALGLHVKNSTITEISGCYAQTNGIGFLFDHSSNIEISTCAAYNNNDNQGGFFLNFCQDVKFVNCNIYHNGFGIKIAHSSNISISNSDLLFNTHNALKIEYDSNNILVSKNEIANNSRIGIYIRKNSTCRLFHNNMHSSLCGIYIMDSFCNARNNWWGLPLGPTLFERRTRDRIYFRRSRVLFFPWFVQKVEQSGSDWDIDETRFSIEINNSRYVEIHLPGVDNDGDKVPDWWEEKWGYDPFTWDNHSHLDPDQDGLNNIEECYTDQWGSNPFRKDIFLEVDWIENNDPDTTNKPPCNMICDVKSMFEEHNITFHIDVGNLGEGEEITYNSYLLYSDIRDYYWDYFLHNDLNNPRKGIFHYCLVCNYGPVAGFAFVGWNHLDSFATCAQKLKDDLYFSRGRLIIGTIIHELGHNCGLTVDDHGGNDNVMATKPFTLQKYRNYKSCMNYRYTYRIIEYSDGSHGKGDFDDWSNLDFSFFKNTHFRLPNKD